MEELRLDELKWLNKPADCYAGEGRIRIKTDPGTDFWQRTYYGFRNDNAPVCYWERKGNFSFTVKTEFDSSSLFDQCGIILYQNSENWCKASIEYEGTKTAKLGSVVTNLGYSDWATTDIDPKIQLMWYRLSRRDQDFLIESSTDGKLFEQMRIFHMHEAIEKARFGLYACSPLESSFTAQFNEISFEECLWKAHEM